MNIHRDPKGNTTDIQGQVSHFEKLWRCELTNDNEWLGRPRTLLTPDNIDRVDAIVKASGVYT